MAGRSVYIAIDEDSGRARRRVNAALECVYGRLSPDVAAAAVAGTADECVSQLRQVVVAGAELILFTPYSSRASCWHRPSCRGCRSGGDNHCSAESGQRGDRLV